VDDWTVYNLGLSYSLTDSVGWASGLTLNAGIRNLTNEKPPFADETFGYFSSLHNSYGRVTWGQVTYSFGAN
jgi:outer membrane receptor protein involved in Fe transport